MDAGKVRMELETEVSLSQREFPREDLLEGEIQKKLDCSVCLKSFCCPRSGWLLYF